MDLYCRQFTTQSGAADVHRIMVAIGAHLRSLPTLGKRAGISPVNPPPEKGAGSQAPSDPIAAADVDVIVAETGHRVLETIQSARKADPTVCVCPCLCAVLRAACVNSAVSCLTVCTVSTHCFTVEAAGL